MWQVGVTSVTIGNSVTYIGCEAFRDCASLTEIINQQAVPQKILHDINADICGMFRGVNKTDCILFVPAGSEVAYREAEVWKDFKKIETMNAD